MTNEEKKVQIALGTYLHYMWTKRNKLRDKGDKLTDKGDKLKAGGYKLTAKGDKLREEGYKILAVGNLLYVNAVIEVYGQDAVINWETGEVKHD